MGVIAKGILRGYQGLFTPVSLGYPLSVFNKNSTLKTLLSIGVLRKETQHICGLACNTSDGVATISTVPSLSF